MLGSVYNSDPYVPRLVRDPNRSISVQSCCALSKISGSREHVAGSRASGNELSKQTNDLNFIIISLGRPNHHDEWPVAKAFRSSS
jgi:hypothetical protein